MRSSRQRWQGRALSRRQFFRTAAGMTGGMLGAGRWFPSRAWARHHVFENNAVREETVRTVLRLGE